MNRPEEALRLLPPLPFDWGWWRHWAWVYELYGWALHSLEDHRGELLPGRQRYPESLEVRAEARARAALGEETEAVRLVEKALALYARRFSQHAPAPARLRRDFELLWQPSSWTAVDESPLS